MKLLCILLFILPLYKYHFNINNNIRTQRAFTYSKLTRETQGVKYVQKLTIKIPERRQWRRSGVFIVNFKHISYLVLVPLLLTLKMKLPAGELFHHEVINNNIGGTSS